MPRRLELSAGEVRKGIAQRVHTRPHQKSHERWNIPVEERRRLGENYYLHREKDEKDDEIWPVKQILKERRNGSQKQYLVDWETHPVTKEEWEPTWEKAEDVGKPAIDEWEAKQLAATLPVGINRKRKRLIPVLRDSSSENEENLAGSADVTPDANRAKRQKTNAPLGAFSPIEVGDSQDIFPAIKFHVQVPALPSDKPDFESVYASQISRADSALGLSSPIESLNIRVPSSSHEPQSTPLASSTTTAPSRRISDQVESPVPQSDPGPSRPSRGEVTRSQSDPIQDSQEIRETAVAEIAEDSRGSSPLFFATRSPSPVAQVEVSSTKEPRTTVPALPPVTETSRPSVLFGSVPGLAAPARTVDSRLQLHPNPNESSSPTVSKPPRRKLFQTASPQRKVVQSDEPHPRNPEEKRAETHSDFKILDENGRRYLYKPSPAYMTSTKAERASTPANRTKSPEMSLRERARNTRPSQGRHTPMSSRRQRQGTPKAFDKDMGYNNSSHVDNSKESNITSPGSNGIPSSAIQIDEPALSSSIAPAPSTYDIALGSSALPIQQSIETETDQSEVQISGTQPGSVTQSQQSTDDDRPRVQRSTDLVPSYPILGDGEHVVLLHAEGKIQEIYTDTIKVKEKSLLRFIERRESVGSSSVSTARITQSNEMMELIERLDDTTTHMDLGLEGSATQYSVASEEAAQYAAYASSKFAFLGLLTDALKDESCSIAIVAKDGPIQSLLEGFFAAKHVQYRRCSSNQTSNATVTAPPSQTSLKIDLLVSGTRMVAALKPQPALIIALDTSFDAQDPVMLAVRSSKTNGQLVPVVHLLVQNSSEHVERCLPKNMPSPQRRRLHMRSTYQARKKLGGPLILYRQPSEEDQPFDLLTVQRAVRKSPERRMKTLAKLLAAAVLSGDFEATWKDDEVPLLDLDLSEGASSKSSTMALGTPRSNAGTPNARKRLLDADGAGSTSSKRQRMTPLHDGTQVSDSLKDTASSIDALQQTLAILRTELAAEKQLRVAAETERAYKNTRLNEIGTSLADLQHRYETRMAQCHQYSKQIKQLEANIENRKKLQERSVNDRQALQEQIKQLQADLTIARDELKGAGGDIATLEQAREQARTLTARNATLEKTVENTRKDFEFTRAQYQDASTKAVEYAGQVSSLETANAELATQASDEKRRLREVNQQNDVAVHLNRIEQLQTEKRGLESLLKRMDDEMKALKKQRGTGVQTRATSVQPPGSPHSRSRGGSPVPGLLSLKAGVSEHGGVGSSSGTGGVSRASLLRHER